jgi:two-component system sensor histidine kinase RegB
MTSLSPEPVVRVDRPPSAPKQDIQPRERLRMRTLILLRWLAIGGQMSALVVVRFALGFQFPVLDCLALIGLSALLNIILILSIPPQRPSNEGEAALQLAFDIVQLGGLLFLTGGAGNPFALLLIGPVILSAATLQGRYTMMLGGLAVVLSFGLALWSLPVPWRDSQPLAQPMLYRLGAGLAVTLGVVLTGAYAWRAAAGAARMELALQAAETVLSREQRLSALGALAAAAAHELGTPLATIAIVAREMALECPAGPLREDAELVSSQAQRCRDILRRLAEAPEANDVHTQLALGVLLEEIVDPFLDDERVKVEWSVVGPPDSAPPELERRPELSHALTSLVDNAMDFARTEVRLIGRYDEDAVTIEVRDDGPGFSPDIFAKLGEPYVTSRPSGENSPSGHTGMGLGFFIAKTLLERTGAQLEFRNDRGGGALVAIRWPREVIEALGPGDPAQQWS